MIKFWEMKSRSHASAMKAFMVATMLLIAVAGCSSERSIQRPNGDMEYLITCEASSGWSACYDKADKACPSGYKALAEDAGQDRKELRVTCPVRNTHSQ
jgi:hypothetical protein